MPSARPMPSLLDRLRDIPVAVVDVETTGASPRFGDRVTEIGVARYEGGELVGQYTRLVDPKRRISAGVIALTGITQAMVDGQPTFADRLDEIVNTLRGAVVVGHNVRFDLGFLSAEFRRAGTTLTNELSDPALPHVLDTVKIARRRFGRGGNGLQALSRRLGVQPTAAHRALADAVTTGQTLENLLEPTGGFGCTLVDAIQAQGGPMPLEPREPELNADLPVELVEAIETRQRVRLRYLDARRKESVREIDPIEIRSFRGTATLVAHCHLRGDRRTFKLERIIAVERLAEIG